MCSTLLLHLAAVGQLLAAVTELQGLDFTACTPDDLAEVFRGLETASRCQDSVEHAVVAEIDSRGIAVEAGCRSVPVFLRSLITITQGDAKRRYKAAIALAPGRALSGAVRPAIYPRTAAALADGSLSSEHARLIVTTIEHLPDVVAAEHDREIEAVLVEQAVTLDPHQLKSCAIRLVFLHDQDGVLADEAYRDRVRGLTVAQRPDGSAHVDGELTAPCAEALLTVLDSLAKPAPAVDGTPDPRTAAARRHDGLLDGLLRLLRDGGLPMTGGTHATILLSITEDVIRARAGLVTTGHGAIISVEQAISICTDLQVIPIIFDTVNAVTYYGDAHRIATPAQRRILIGRDQGCSFPGCEIPPAWCEAHHVQEFQCGGKTSVKNLALLCGYHHREHLKLGWTCSMTDGIPMWTPPSWVDPLRVPRRNTAHL